MPENELLRELERLEQACGELPGRGGEALCLLRVASGLDPEVWQKLKREHDLDNWRVVPGSRLGPAILGMEGGRPALLDFLRREMDRAKHCQQPLALALIAPEAASALDSVYELAVAQLRSFDLALRLKRGAVAVALSGTPLASAERQMGSLLRRMRQSLAPTLVCSAGLVGYGGLVELDAQALLDRADQALCDARRLGGNRLEVAPSADAVLASRESLVRASEKHFLFTGKKLSEK